MLIGLGLFTMGTWWFQVWSLKCISLKHVTCHMLRPSMHLKFRIAYLWDHLGDWGLKGAIVCPFISPKQTKYRCHVSGQNLSLTTSYSFWLHCLDFGLEANDLAVGTAFDIAVYLQWLSSLIVSNTMCRSWFLKGPVGFSIVPPLL